MNIILNGSGDIFDEKKCFGLMGGQTDGRTDRCKPVYPPLFQSGGIKTAFSNKVMFPLWRMGSAFQRKQLFHFIFTSLLI